MQTVHTTDVIRYKSLCRRLICSAFIRSNHEPGTKHHLVVWFISEFLTLELEHAVTHSIARYPYHRQPFHYSIHFISLEGYLQNQNLTKYSHHESAKFSAQQMLLAQCNNVYAQCRIYTTSLPACFVTETAIQHKN